VDRDLWGSFWQGDVIAPGYRLPALELAYLRVTRLDETIQTPDPQGYLQTLQMALLQFPSGAWVADLGSRPALCLIYDDPEADSGEETQAEGSQIDYPQRPPPSAQTPLYLIVWLVDNVIAAGYKDNFAHAPGYQLLPLGRTRPPSPQLIQVAQDDQEIGYPLTEWQTNWPGLAQASRIDHLIRLHRAYSHLAGTPAGERIGRWLAAQRHKDDMPPDPLPSPS